MGENAFVSLTSSTSGLWVAYGHVKAASIFRLDPLTLRRLAETWPAPEEQGTIRVVATSDGAWRNGLALAARLLPDGQVGPTVRLAGAVESAVAQGDDELVLTDADLLLRVSPEEKVRLVPHPGSQCWPLTKDETSVWLRCGTTLNRVPEA